MNLKHVNGVATNEGPTVELGAEEKYFATCFRCYQREIDKALLLKIQGAASSATRR